MTYPTNRLTLGEVFLMANKGIQTAYSTTGALWGLSETVPLKRWRIAALYTELAHALKWIDRASVYSGIGAYAQAQLGEPALDVVAEFTAMRTELQALHDWIDTNFPKDTDGYFILNDEVTGDSLEFTVAQLTAFRPIANDFMQTIS